jgi:hypothetical protein
MRGSVVQRLHFCYKNMTFPNVRSMRPFCFRTFAQLDMRSLEALQVVSGLCNLPMQHSVAYLESTLTKGENIRWRAAPDAASAQSYDTAVTLSVISLPGPTLGAAYSKDSDALLKT